MSFSKLLEEPFGPYPDHYILNPTFARRGPFRPTLTSVLMTCAGKDIGLDETELLDEAPATSRFVKHDVVVIGELEIEQLDWLSDQGRKWLSYDLRRRDDEKSTSTKASQLTLEAVYGDVNSGSKISVWVKFVKNMSAAYKTVEDEPDSLFLFAADKRSFRIGSLDVKTFSLSRDFIERYTIRRMIHELIDGSGSSKTPRTPITKRNIEWLVKQYIRQIVPKDKNIRYIYNPWSAGIVTNDQGAQTLTKPRHSRPVHKAEIRKIFAKHCEWILADQIAALRSPNARYLDIPQWYKFVQECRVVNPPAVGGRSDIASSLTRFGGKREDWQKRIDNALATPLHWQQERELQKASRKALPRVTPSAQPPLHQPRPIQPLTRHSPVVPSSKFQYDSDFSEASTPPLSDSESEVADQRLLEKIPWYCRVPPELESHHLWRCPGCRVYQIDLLHLDDDELEEIPEQFAKTLRSIRSKADDVPKSDEVLVAFGHLVHQHYERHLRELGVQIVDEDGDVSVRKWPEERTRRKSRRLNTRSASAA